jgi:hypothetical protein
MSGTTTITLAGNSTGYGLFSGSEVFNLSGFNNTVLSDGANDAINITGGGQDLINLNYSGFTGPVTDSINLGTASFDTVSDGNALYGANVTVAGNGGPTTIALTNHGGSTNIALGYTGNPAYEQALGEVNTVTLNGDASNNVAFTAGGYAHVAIGGASDGFTSYASNVAFFGAGNTLVGGDEAFTVSNANGSATTVALGNGDNDINLSGGYNTVSVGDGDNTVGLSGLGNTASFGAGNNIATVEAGAAALSYATGDAGASDSLSFAHAHVTLTGGDENFTIQAGSGSYLSARLGNGNNTLNFGDSHAFAVFGNSIANTGDNSFTALRGGNVLSFIGGTDQATLYDKDGPAGHDNIFLHATEIGTTITTYGAYERATLSGDANATINDLGTNGGTQFRLFGDHTGGFGQIVINGLANDFTAHITLINASAYTITADDTPAGGITLHFDHGTVDLVGLQAVPNNLIS